MDHRIIERNIQSLKNDKETPVEFKNLTNSIVKLYWIDFDDSKHKPFAELNPIHRKDIGLKNKIFNSNPWLAKEENTGRNVLLNGRKYFNAPRSNIWMKWANGWMSERWNQVISKDKQEEMEKNPKPNNEDRDTNRENYFEVLILPTGSRSLKEIALLKVCTLYKSNSTELECLPKTLKYETETCREKYFWMEASAKEKTEAENSDNRPEQNT